MQLAMQFANVSNWGRAQFSNVGGLYDMARYDETTWIDSGSSPNTLENDTQTRPVILAVGDVRQWNSAGRELPADSQIAFAEFDEINDDLLQSLSPDIVMSPVLSRSFDCLDLAQALYENGFKGRFRVVAPDMPNPRVIQSEISALCPSLDVAFIFCGKAHMRHLH